MLRPTIVLGDSHTVYFRAAWRRGLFGARPMTFCMVVGATAFGLSKSSSKTAAAVKFRSALETAASDTIVVLHLGEIDCGYNLWVRAARHGGLPQDHMDQALASYAAFVDELVSKGFRRIIITGATLPAIDDGPPKGLVAQERASVGVSQADRTAMTLAFNERLAAEAKARALCYVDVTSEMLDPSTGVLAAEYRNRDEKNFHLDAASACVPWSLRLGPALQELDAVRSGEVH